jgi:hypothetical protein
MRLEDPMSILTMFELHGDPDELFALQEEKIVPIVEPLAAQNGGISSIVVKVDNGLLVVNHWENEEGMEKVAAEVRPQATAAGMPEPANWRQYEVLAHRTPGG